jgi:tetratricopeptide (TPR) repeat protein
MLNPAPISLNRRCAIALTSLVLSGVLFHGQVATALVTRGDEFLQRGRVEQATRYYARALLFDERSAIAADRFAFAGILLRTPQSLETAIAAASQGLAASRDDIDLLTDRALCYQLERRYREAYHDFARAAVLRRDARLYHFAGWAALRAGDARAARMLWRAALAADASFTPARSALARALAGR